MKYLILVILIFALVSGPLAQLSDLAGIDRVKMGNGFGVKPASSPFSLIDMSKITWSNSYSVGFFSGGGQSGSLGLLNTRMLYTVSSKLTLSFDLGIAHNPGALFDGNRNNSIGDNAAFLPGFSLDYHPSKYFGLRIDYRQVDFSNPLSYRSSYRNNSFNQR